MPTPKPVRGKASNPLPLQFTPFRKEQFQTDEGIDFFNQTMAQVFNALNRGTGQAGPVVIPAGLDVAGSTVTGLGSPSGPSDAVSLGHAQGNYGAPAVGPQLDIGGDNTLKGLAYCYQKLQNLPPIPTVPMSGSNADGNWTIDGTGTITQRGFVADMGAGDYTQNFPIPFTTTVGLIPVATCVYPSGSGVYVVEVAGSVTVNGFTVHQAELNNLGMNWIAIGN